MTYQHREFQSRLRDTKRLWLYAQSIVSDYKALSASLAKVESSSQHWENEAKESIEKMARAEAKRDAARHDASMARMDSDATGSARVKVEFELSRVQNALAVVQEAMRKTRLAIWQTNESLCFWNSGLIRMKCSLSGQKSLKRKRLWRRLTRKAST